MGKIPTLDESIKKILQIGDLEETPDNRLLVYSWIKEKHQGNRIEQAALLVISELLEPRLIQRIKEKDIGKDVTIRFRYLGVISEPELAIRGMDSTGIALAKIRNDELDEFLLDEPALGQEIEVKGAIMSVDERSAGVVLDSSREGSSREGK